MGTLFLYWDKLSISDEDSFVLSLKPTEPGRIVNRSTAWTEFRAFSAPPGAVRQSWHSNHEIFYHLPYSSDLAFEDLLLVVKNL